MKKLKPVLVLLFLLFTFSALAAGTRVVSTKSFSISIPKDWQNEENLFCLPYVFLGPKKLSKRAILSVVPSDKEGIDLSGELTTTAEEVYQLRRKLWVEEHEGKVISFFPYQKISIGKISPVHRFGFKYKLGEDTFVESSLYFHCGKNLVNVKSLALEKDENGQEQLEKMIKTVSCKK